MKVGRLGHVQVFKTVATTHIFQLFDWRKKIGEKIG